MGGGRSGLSIGLGFRVLHEPGAGLMSDAEDTLNPKPEKRGEVSSRGSQMCEGMLPAEDESEGRISGEQQLEKRASCFRWFVEAHISRPLKP